MGIPGTIVASNVGFKEIGVRDRSTNLLSLLIGCKSGPCHRGEHNGNQDLQKNDGIDRNGRGTMWRMRRLGSLGP